jgi:hypothetical protein
MTIKNKSQGRSLKSGAVYAVAAGLLMPAVQANAFEIAEGLTLNGFIDMSLTRVEPEDGKSDTSSGLDQFELQFMYDFGEGLTANVDIEYQDDGDGETTDVEQAYISYAISEALSIKAGRFLSYSGWETEEPTGLYQFSGTGYAKYFYGAYQQGVSVYYGTDLFSAAVSVVNDIGTLTGDFRDAEDPAVELMAAIHPGDAWTLKAFYMAEESEINEEDTQLFNVWSSYVIGDLTLAAEANYSENAGAAVAIAGDEAEAQGFLLMANYAMGDWGFTVRYHESEVETEGGTTVEDISAITFSPSYKVSDNLLIVAEYRMDEEDVSGNEFDSYAIEALVTF